MNVNNDAMKVAQSVIESKRQYALVEAQKHLDEISNEIPQALSLISELSNTCVELSSVVFSSGADKKTDIEKIMNKNIKNQRQLELLLTQNGFSNDYLDVKYSCSLCEDTGFVLGKRCECLTSLLNKQFIEAFNDNNNIKLDKSFESFSLSYYDDKNKQTMRAIFENCRDYADRFSRQAKSILMVGGTGLGKTHLSIAISAQIMKKGFSALYSSAPDVFRRLQNEYYGKGEPGIDTMEAILKTDLFILDDLGAEIDNQVSLSLLYNIVNSRLNLDKPTIISTNLTFKEIEKRYTDKVASRLITMYRCLKFVGKDIRQIKMTQEG